MKLFCSAANCYMFMFLIILLKLIELHLLSCIPLLNVGCQELIPKGKYFVNLILRITTVAYAHT